MEYPEFKKMWVEIAERFKTQNQSPEGETPGAPVDTCSPEVAAFLDQISEVANDREKLSALLALPSNPTKEDKPWAPKEQEALDALYSKYGNCQTREQKLAILDLISGGGPLAIHAIPPIQTKEEEMSLRLRLEEHEYLVNAGVITPTYC